MDFWKKLEKIKYKYTLLAFLIIGLSGIAKGVWAGYNHFAKTSELIALAEEYHFDKEQEQREELRKLVFECKRLYGADYSKTPDEFTLNYCRDAEIKLEETKED